MGDLAVIMNQIYLIASELVTRKQLYAEREFSIHARSHVRENGHYSGFLLELCSSWRSNIPDDYDFISEPQHACEGRKFAQIVAYKENFRLGKACVGLYRTYILYIEW